MLRKLLPLLVISMWGMTVVSLPKEATATTPLTRADIEKIRNLVQLKPKNKQQRPARSSDAMFPGDGVSTGRASLAELRFNDRSLARVGEQAVFQFLPRTRNFKLSNGTVLLLIPPKQGQTRIQTPNAAAAIRGSALFVRYDEQTDTTVVGALTNSRIEVSNKDASQSRVLEAGQMLVIVKDRIKGLYEFDLRNFYERSDLVQGLDLARKNGVPSADPAIAQVQEETTAAVAAQKPIIVGAGVIKNPSFLKLTGSSPTSPSVADNNINNNNSPIESFQEIGDILSNNDKKKDNSSGSTSVTTPSVITPTKIESPNPPTIPTKIESPNPPTIPTKIESPNPPTIPTKIESPNPPTIPTKIESPNPPTIPTKIESPNPPTTPTKIESPNPPTIPTKIESPNPPTIPTKIESPNPPVITPNPPVITPNPPVITPNPPVITPNPPVITPNPPVITPNPPVITPNPPVITPNPPVITPNPPVITPNPPVITPNPPVITPNPPVITPNPPVIESPPNPPVIESPPNPPTTPNPPVKPST